MRVRAMSQIMAETGDSDTLDIPVIYIQIWLLLFQFLCYFQRQICSPNTMFKPLVGPRWKYVRGYTKLHQVPQSLKLLCVNDFYQVCWKPHKSVNWVHICCREIFCCIVPLRICFHWRILWRLSLVLKAMLVGLYLQKTWMVSFLTS